jgi:D-alanyl-lipoteichoic acid acyltransferase DltB (MBOAT superfamily)
MATFVLVLQFLLYVAAARLTLKRLAGMSREVTFAVVNLAGFYFFFVADRDYRAPVFFAAYLGLALIQYITLVLFAEKSRRLPWLAFFTPIFFLVVIRYVPAAFSGHLRARFENYAGYFLGLSYLAFRTSRLVLEIRNGAVKRPSPWQYFSFCFFVPTMTVGPINTYANYQRGFEVEPYRVPVGRASLRILIGLVKYQFLGNLCNCLTYQSLLLDEHPHHWMDLPVAMVFYYLFLYCNFSGFCDMAIGAAALIGIPVPENFENPLAARNMKEFWNRWHITLSGWMRDLVFSPLSKFLVGKFGSKLADHAITVTILVTFLLIGIWHGAGLNYALFGLAQALGVATVHYYTIFLKKRLGREGFKAYNQNRWIQAVAVVTTFCYYAATLFLFANTSDEMKEIFSILQ